MEVSEDIIFNFLVELKKKDIHPVDRANIIKDYMKVKNCSIKVLSMELGIPTATIHDYLNYSKLDKYEYSKLLDKGVTKTEIFKALRNSDYKHKRLHVNELNCLIEDINSRLRGYISNPLYDDKTIELIKDLKNTLNRIELHIEQRLK